MRRGFTLIELLVTIAIGAVVFGIFVLALNPGGQLAQARNSERNSHLQTIAVAIRGNLTDTRTGFSCASGALPATSTKMASGAGSYNIAPCLVPIYLPAMPFDPSAPGAHYASVSDYDTGYFVSQATSTGVVTVTAPSAELGQTIAVTR